MTMSACVLAPYRQSRKLWEERFGRLADTEFVMHRCDEPRCINMAHLFIGSASANAADMYLKGRAPQTHQTAENVARARKRVQMLYPGLPLGPMTGKVA